MTMKERAGKVTVMVLFSRQCFHSVNTGLIAPVKLAVEHEDSFFILGESGTNAAGVGLHCTVGDGGQRLRLHQRIRKRQPSEAPRTVEQSPDDCRESQGWAM